MDVYLFSTSSGGSVTLHTDEATKDIVVKVKDQLLQGLSDDSEPIR